MNQTPFSITQSGSASGIVLPMDEWKSAVGSSVELPVRPPADNTYPFRLSGVPFGRNPNDSAFVKLHIGVTRSSFQELDRQNFYPEFQTGYSINEFRANPETKLKRFLENLDKIGGEYGWSNRRKYQEDNYPQLEEQMKNPGSRLFEFRDNEDLVGFCMVMDIYPNWKPKPHEKGISKGDLVHAFSKQEDAAEFPRPKEIYKIGILPELKGKKYGKSFLAEMTRQIFSDGDFNMIYLDTRDTNPEGTEEFYAKMNFRAFAMEVLENDLVTDVDGWAPGDDAPDIIAGL